ncbi:MAG: hypothetical protein ACE5IO_06575 [Thermoplasmata archaeon]
MIVLLLPLLVGFGLARLEREKAPTWSLGAAIGLVIGIVAGLQVLPLAYPLYAVVTRFIVGNPSIYIIGEYLFTPDNVLWMFGVEEVWMSPALLFHFIPLCVLSSVLGQAIGRRFFAVHPSEPWVED